MPTNENTNERIKIKEQRINATIFVVTSARWRHTYPVFSISTDPSVRPKKEKVTTSVAVFSLSSQGLHDLHVEYVNMFLSSAHKLQTTNVTVACSSLTYILNGE
jgi:hypothetical protein